ncbi:ABC transporter permease [Flavihumibacter solisilvae]|uniref:ABC transporter permease n=1 Tax=Flavihumibacter solisilvae TaxID=1349421 RepID=A0A0C1IXT5_9BACT|nr:ABC transporter permease [Flavihumibacter solisilvae]KIC95299.1 hypothetical protein OI18_06730 [Flavihumibacter solisilvae]
MLRNYFKIAWRNLANHRFYSLVNIFGLSSGIAFTLLIAAFVWSELQVNKRLKNAGDQYIIQSKWKDPNQGLELTTFGPLAKELKEQYPNLVAEYCRWDGITSVVSHGEKSFREGIQIVDSTMLTMYGFELLQGNIQTALNAPFTAVITEDRAKRYFGRTDVAGETLTIESFSGTRHDFLVTGVMKKPYRNSVTWLTDENDNQVYVSTSNLDYFSRNMNWGNAYIVGYLQLQPGVTARQMEGPMLSIIRQQAPQAIEMGMKPFVVPLKEYYLGADNGLIRKMLLVLSGIAFFILLMAIVNFINLAVSRSAGRMKEVGMRKVLGGMKKQLVIQFLVESTLIVCLAMVIAMVLYVVAADFFAQVLGKPLPHLHDFPLYFILYPLVLALLLGIAAGIYPAFILSALRSVETLKGKLSSVKDNILLRKTLVVFQFSIATVVLVSSLVITNQVALFFRKDLGYNKDFIITAQLPRSWNKSGINKVENIRRQFTRLPEVREATVSFEITNGQSSGSVAIYRSGADSTSAVSSQLLMSDEYFAGTYGIPMLAGEFFSRPGYFTDSSRIVINESQARALGWKRAEDALGGQVMFVGGGGFPSTIAGVTKDFHFGSLHKVIPPVTFVHVGVTNTYRMLSVKMKAGNTGEAISALEKKWSALLPGVPFEYKFLDESIRMMYRTELQLKKAAYTATILAIIIVLLGVLGLVSLNIQKRTREIGIRKVLGASVESIILLFIREFVPVMLIAAAIACPSAYMLMDKWLDDFVYRINIDVTPFVLSVAMLCALTAILILFQTFKAAITSPARSLKTE